MYLGELHRQHYTVFVVKGNLPPGTESVSMTGHGMQLASFFVTCPEDGNWHHILLGDDGKPEQAKQAPAKKKPKKNKEYDPEMAMALALSISEQDVAVPAQLRHSRPLRTDSDDDIAAAIALSLQQHKP